MNTPTTKTALCWTLGVLILAFITSPVSAGTIKTLVYVKPVWWTDTSVTLQFQAPSPRADEYHVEYSRADRPFGPVTKGVTVQDTNKDTYTVTQGQLTPATAYILRVASYAGGRRIEPGNHIEITTSSRSSVASFPGVLTVIFGAMGAIVLSRLSPS